MTKLCEYGCGKEALHQFKNGKWCCSNDYRKCSFFIEKIRKKNIGKKRNVDSISRYKKKYPGLFDIEKMRYNPDKPNEKEIQVHCKYIYCVNSLMNNGWFVPTKIQISERVRCYKSGIGKSFFFCSNDCKINFFKKFYDKILYHKKIHFGKNNGMYGISSPNKYRISNIKIKYLLFSKIEEMRYNPNIPIEEKEIQVHCKNHNCPNSKERGGWFTPYSRQITERIRHIENKGIDNSYFYCSEECKQACPLYRSNGNDPYKDILTPYTIQEYNIWKQIVLEQDNYECQKCESKENLHCHHIIPVKIEPMFALDPDNGIVLCQNCHYEIGHKTGTECSTGNLANKYCGEMK